MTGGVRNVFSFQLELANVGWLNLVAAGEESENARYKLVGVRRV